jgi:hypothetical protein
VKLEIVSHCWQYGRLLTYQLSSLMVQPPRQTDVTMTVFLTEEDRYTMEVVRYFCELDKASNLRIRPWCLSREKLWQREIGRNMAALATTADWVWFTDCDYCFGADCLDRLAVAVAQATKPLVFPRHVLISRSHEEGDQAIEQASGGPRLLTIQPDDYVVSHCRRAIGGIQIANGEIVRRLGYCKNSRSQHRLANHWMRTHSDRHFRVSLGTSGQGVNVPNVYRIRHSKRGRHHIGVVL